MELISDILLIAGAFGAGLYCLVLSRRLKRFNDLERGVGGAVAVLSAQVDDMTRALERARVAAGNSVETLEGTTARAEGVAHRLELLLAAMHDLPEPPAAPAPAPASAGRRSTDRPAAARTEGPAPGQGRAREPDPLPLPPVTLRAAAPADPVRPPKAKQASEPAAPGRRWLWRRRNAAESAGRIGPKEAAGLKLRFFRGIPSSLEAAE